MSANGPFSTRDLFRYLEGDLSQREASELEAQLASDDRQGARIDGARRLIGLLGAEDPLSTPGDVKEAVWGQIDAGTTPVRATGGRVLAGRSWRWALASTLAAGLVVLTVWLVHPAHLTDSAAGWRSKASGSAGLAGIEVYRQLVGGAERVQHQIDRGDRLLFAYRNLGPAPFTRLMILAVGSGGEAFWFYPAFVDPRTDPVSIPIAGAPVTIGLSDAIAHDLRPGKLALIALFSRRDYRVSEIERLAKAVWWEGSARPLALEDTETLQQVMEVEVR